MASDSSNGGNNNANKNNDRLASLLKSMGGGDDCDRPACDDTKSALTAALQRVGGRSNNKDASSEGTTRNKKQPQSVVKDKTVPNGYKACPPTRDEIGVSTWSLLHSMVRFYPLTYWHTSRKLLPTSCMCSYCVASYENVFIDN